MASRPYTSPQSGRRGRVAIIAVLLCIVFLSILIVAFMSSMSAKLQLSKAGADMGKVQILAETAVNIAISQVHDATVLGGENRYAGRRSPA